MIEIYMEEYFPLPYTNNERSYYLPWYESLDCSYSFFFWSGLYGPITCSLLSGGIVYLIPSVSFSRLVPWVWVHQVIIP